MLVGIGGFAVGYYLGAKAGNKALEELYEAWEVIKESDEFKAAMSGASAFATNWVSRNISIDRDYTQIVSDLATQVMDFIQKRDLRVVS